MNRIVTYLTFNGNCHEAMQFYQQCLGGKLMLQTVGESPRSEKLDASMKSFIVHASLKNDNMILMGTDLIGDNGHVRGNDVSIFLECSSQEEINQFFDKLSVSCKATFPIRKTYWGALFGGLTDKYGFQWLFHLKK